MPEDQIRKIADGSIGWYWPGRLKPRAVTREPLRGYLRLDDDGSLRLTALDEQDPMAQADSSHYPQIVTGVTEHGPVALLDIFSRGRTTQVMGPHASVERFSARTLITGADIRTLATAKLTSMTANFFGVSEWFGLTTSQEKFESHEDGRLKAYSLALEQTPDEAVPYSRSREISVSGHWGVSGPEDNRQVCAPVSVACRTSTPQRMWLLRYPILRVQDLLSLAYEGFVAAGSGTAHIGLDGKGGRLWDQYLMRAAESVKPPKNTQLPFFALNDLGGIVGLTRWCDLCSRHLRAVRPVVERYREGPASAPVRVMEVAAGIEYWVASHRRTRKWANKSYPKGKDRGGHARRLADFVGDSFQDLVGDTEKWSTRFWDTYNDLKHRPKFNPDEREMRILAESGRLLLMAALLNRIASSRIPAKCIFLRSRHRTWQLKSEVSDLLT